MSIIKAVYPVDSGAHKCIRKVFDGKKQEHLLLVFLFRRTIIENGLPARILGQFNIFVCVNHKLRYRPQVVLKS